MVLQAEDPAFRYKPAHRVENACASGSAALFSGLRAIDPGEARIALVVGVEKMTDAIGPEVGRNLLRASYLVEESEGVAGGFAGVFGETAEAYFARFGDRDDALAAIAAKIIATGWKIPMPRSARTSVSISAAPKAPAIRASPDR